ncbi:MAG: ZIP family metal transporter [Chitinophagales bacterium]
MTTIQIVLLIAASFIGVFAAWMLRNKTQNKFLSVLLSFSGAYLLGAVVLHLLPEVFESNTIDDGHDYTAAIYILIGFLIQLLIVQFTKGIEHGHLHLHDHFSKGYVAGVVFGLSVHALMEGIPLAAPEISSEQIQPLYWGIVVHKIPETFALATVLFFSVKKHSYAFIFTLFFALMTPIGSLAGNYFAKEDAFNFNWLIAIVCGSLIHISTTIIFEASGKAHKMSIIKLAVIIGGFGLSLLSAILE